MLVFSSSSLVVLSPDLTVNENGLWRADERHGHPTPHRPSLRESNGFEPLSAQPQHGGLGDRVILPSGSIASFHSRGRAPGRTDRGACRAPHDLRRSLVLKTLPAPLSEAPCYGSRFTFGPGSPESYIQKLWYYRISPLGASLISRKFFSPFSSQMSRMN